VKAGDVVNYVAQQVGGRVAAGPTAQAGGSDAAALPAALASVVTGCDRSSAERRVTSKDQSSAVRYSHARAIIRTNE
jgi:hypothetical protein